MIWLQPLYLIHEKYRQMKRILSCQIGYIYRLDKPLTVSNLNLDTCCWGVKVVPAWRGCKISIQGQLDECHPGSVFRLNNLKIRLLSRQHFSKINKSVSCLIVDDKPLVGFIISLASADGTDHLVTLSGQIVFVLHVSITCSSEERFWKDY